MLPTATRAMLTDRQLVRQTVDYYSSPELEWMARLPDNDDLFPGNAIVPSPFNEDILYITTLPGKLLVISAKNGSVLASIQPDRRTHNGGGIAETFGMYSSSGVAFGQLESGDHFLVYSIRDEPPPDSASTTGPKT